MASKERLILALLMSSVMVFMVMLLVTFLSTGLRTDFLFQSLTAFFIACPGRGWHGLSHHKITSQIVAHQERNPYAVSP